MRLLNKLKDLIFNLLREESYEEDFQRNFSLNYMAPTKKKKKFI